MTQGHRRGDLGKSRSRNGLKRFVLGATVATALVNSSGCMEAAIAYQGHQIRRGLENAARIQAAGNENYSGGPSYAITSPKPVVPSRPYWSGSPIGTYDAELAGKGGAELQLYPEGVQLIGDRGGWYSIPYADIWRVESKPRSLLYWDDTLNIDTSSGRFTIYLKNLRGNVSDVEEYIEEKAGVD